MVDDEFVRWDGDGGEGWMGGGEGGWGMVLLRWA